MRFRWLCLIVLAFGAASAADDSRWRKLAWTAQRYAPAPDRWQHIESSDGAVRFSMPCDPQWSMDEAAGLPVRRYACNVGARSYQVMLMPNNFATEPNAFEEYWTGAERSMIRQIEKLGVKDISSTPQMRVAYECGLKGRQLTITFPERRIEFRALASRYGYISMKVIDDANKPSGDLYEFFNSLEMR